MSNHPCLFVVDADCPANLPASGRKSRGRETFGNRLRNWISPLIRRRDSRRSKVSRTSATVQLLEVRQVLTGDEMEDVIARFHERTQEAYDHVQQTMVSKFQVTSGPTLSGFVAEVGTLTQFGLGAQPTNGPPVQIQPAIITELTQLRGTAQNDIGDVDDQIVGQITSEANRMKDEFVYDIGLSGNFDFDSPAWIYYYSDTMTFDYNVVTGDYSIQITDTYEDPTPDDGYDTDMMQVNGILTSFGGEESFEVTTSRTRTTDDNSRANSWAMTYSQTGNANPTFDLNRTYDSGTHKFTSHIVVANDVIDTAESSAILKLGPVDARIGYRKMAGEEIFDGGVKYQLANKLAFDAAYKQYTDIGVATQAGLVYSFDENSWLKAHVGTVDLESPALPDYSYAGGELSLRIVSPEQQYLSGELFDTTVCPVARRSTLFLDLFGEMRSEQQTLHNDMSEFVYGTRLDWNY